MNLVKLNLQITIEIEDSEDIDEIGEFLATDFENMLDNGEDYVKIDYIGSEDV